LLVDDHAIVRQGLAALLGRDAGLAVAGEAGTYDEALAAVGTLKPDCVVLDLSLHDRSGLDWISEARAKGYGGKIVVLSMHDAALFEEKARARGADGYVMKDRAEDALVGAIRAALGRTAGEGGGEAAEPAAAAAPGAEGGGEGGLTARESEVLYWVGAGLTTKDIAEKLGLSARTVDVHRLNVKRKLGCGTFAEVLAKAMEHKRRVDAG